MVGDWVKCHYNENEWITKVSSIYPDTIWVEDTEEFEGMELREGQFEPIPITPKILKKNGFIQRESGWYIPNTPRLDLGILSFGIDDGCGTGFAKMPNEDFVFFAEYVHKLQHALRLAEIEKEIVL